MSTEIIIPRLGWSMEEGTFGEWLKSTGDPVQAGDMVFVLEGDKAAHEIESFDSGVLWIPPDAPAPGETVKVGQRIGFLLAEGEAPPPIAYSNQPTSSTSASPSAQRKSSAVIASGSLKLAAGPAARRRARQLNMPLASVATSDLAGRITREDVERAAVLQPSDVKLEHTKGPRGAPRPAFATPRARRRAQELGFAWDHISGTGRNGRIRERDVIAHRASIEPSQSREIAPVVPGRHQVASKMRLAIAQRMLAGVQQTASVTLTTKVDATRLVQLRMQMKQAAQDGAVVPSYNDMLIKIVAAALPACPLLNACWYRDGFHIYDEIHIAIAVETSAGLIAPVIRNAANLSLMEIATRTRDLIQQARDGTLDRSQLQGGTFTISNLGMFGIDYFTPIINLPQSATLGVGRIVREPVVRDGAIVVGDTLCLSLTFDHRVLDGAPAAQWLATLTPCKIGEQFHTSGFTLENRNS